jgi:hypothetical protein
MNKQFTIEELAKWIAYVKKAAKNDICYSILWFKGTDTDDCPFSIVAGWQKGFSADQADLFCISKSNPEYAMSIKIVENEGPYAYIDYDIMNMPTTEDGEVDDTCIPLEWSDDPEYVAQFFMTEWERIMKEHSKEEL